MKKISEEDIKSGNVMGPLLVMVLFALVLLILVIALWEIIGYVALATASFIFLLWFWFVGIPRIWNWLVDMVEK